MSNIRDKIAYDVEAKGREMEKILIMLMNSSSIIELSKLLEILDNEDIKRYITKEEVEAIYNLAYAIRMSAMKGTEQNKRLYESLRNTDGSLNRNNLLKFVEYEVSDMAKFKISHPNLKWKLNVNKIFREIEKQEGTTKSFEVK